ncbi:hypothetical protein MCELHM10_02968 [Paracoccaceae bacterium]|jgi:predicted flap endonuclease-1-like 5' DNA nuclease
MQTSDNRPDNGNELTIGGWVIAALAGALMIWVLRYQLGYYLVSSIAFGTAIGLIVLLMLLIAVSRSEPIVAPSRVRRIVPSPERATQGEPVKVAAAVAVPMAPAPAVAPVSAPATITPMFETPDPVPAPVKPAPVRPAPAVAPVGPVRLKAARKGGADDLKQLEGVGPALEKLLNSLGFYHFDQIASWTDADIATVDAEMKSFKGRIARDRWVAQAKIIATEGLEAFRERAKTNNY